MLQPAPHFAASPTPNLRLASGGATADEIARLVGARLRERRASDLGYVRSRLSSREDAEDVLQDFALKAIQGAARVSDASKVDAWLSVTLRNALFDRYRRNAGRARLQDAVRVDPTADVDGDAGEDLERPLACLAEAIGALKPDYGALLRSAELEERPLKALAGTLGITANNAGVRAHRAREALRREMQARCSACPARCPLASRFLARLDA
jgi:RNA polymerase sigma-70 factor (ECF subfamily)